MPKVNKNFNRAEYNKEYQKKHYYRLNIVLPKEYRELVDTAVKRSGMTKNAWLRDIVEQELHKADLL